MEVTLIRRINYIMKRVGGALLGSGEALLDLIPSIQILSSFHSTGIHPKNCLADQC